MPENALAGGEEDIGRDEPSYLRIVVTGPEVVEARLFVIHISTVTEGIILSECGREWAQGWQQFAPRIQP